MGPETWLFTAELHMEVRMTPDARSSPASNVTEVWPRLPLAVWQDTYTTLHMWTQIVGKIRERPCPMPSPC